MSQGIINKERQVSLNVIDDEPVVRVSGNNVAISDYYGSSIESSETLPIYQAKQLFVEKEQELLTSDVKVKEKQVSKRLNDANATFQERSLSLLKRMRDSIVNFKDSVIDRFTGKRKTLAKVNIGTAQNKKNSVSKATSSQPVFKDEIVPSDIKDDFEKGRIEDIEKQAEVYDQELKNLNHDDMRKLMELICKISIMVNSLGARLTKKEMRTMQKLINSKIEDLKKTYNTGRGWNIASVAIQGVSASLSFLGIPGAVFGKVTLAGRVFKSISDTSGAISGVGSGVSKFGDMQSEKATASRTGFEGEKTLFESEKNEYSKTADKTSSSTQEMFAAWREINRNHNSSALRAAGG